MTQPSSFFDPYFISEKNYFCKPSLNVFLGNEQPLADFQQMTAAIPTVNQ